MECLPYCFCPAAGSGSASPGVLCAYVLCSCVCLCVSVHLSVSPTTRKINIPQNTMVHPGFNGESPRFGHLASCLRSEENPSTSGRHNMDTKQGERRDSGGLGLDEEIGTEEITIRSKDKKTFTVTKNAARMSKLIRTTIEGG